MAALRRTLGAVAMAAALAGCAGAVTEADLASTISAELAELGVVASAVNCPGDLAATAGESVRCEFVVDGTPFGVTAKVTSVQSDRALFDVIPEVPLVSRDEVMSAIDEDVSAQGIALDGPSTCPGALIGQVGQTLHCQYSVDGQPVGATAEVISMQGAEATWSISSDAPLVTAGKVASTIDEQLIGEGIVTDGPTWCAGALIGQIGRTISCEYGVGGQLVDVTATVRSVTDGETVYDLTFQGRPIVRDVLGQQVAELVGSELQVPVQAQCAGGLEPIVDRSVICTASTDQGSIDLMATVTAVNLGMINYVVDVVPV